MMGREYHREYSRNYYHKRKAELLEILGGKCINCGSTEDLEFDHKDPGSKKFPISKLLNFSKSKVLEELGKCQLLCKACHLEKTLANKDGFSNRVRGELVSSSILTESQVIEIKKLREIEGLSLNKIMRYYPEVSKGAIAAIIAGKTWKHVIINR